MHQDIFNMRQVDKGFHNSLWIMRCGKYIYVLNRILPSSYAPSDTQFFNRGFTFEVLKDIVGNRQHLSQWLPLHPPFQHFNPSEYIFLCLFLYARQPTELKGKERGKYTQRD